MWKKFICLRPFTDFYSIMIYFDCYEADGLYVITNSFTSWAQKTLSAYCVNFLNYEITVCKCV